MSEPLQDLVVWARRRYPRWGRGSCGRGWCGCTRRGSPCLHLASTWCAAHRLHGACQVRALQRTTQERAEPESQRCAFEHLSPGAMLFFASTSHLVPCGARARVSGAAASFEALRARRATASGRSARGRARTETPYIVAIAASAPMMRSPGLSAMTASASAWAASVSRNGRLVARAAPNAPSGTARATRGAARTPSGGPRGGLGRPRGAARRTARPRAARTRARAPRSRSARRRRGRARFSGPRARPGSRAPRLWPIRIAHARAYPPVTYP
jgi:hypothetical protein